jgi:hypothetical protein
MNTEEALRVVEGVLNEYRAIERMSEVLGNVMQAEVAEAELRQQADILRKEIVSLEEGKVATKKRVADAGRAAQDSHAVNMAKMKNVEDAKWKDIKEAEVRLEGLRNMAGEMEADYAKRLKFARDHIALTEADIAAASERLAKIEAKIAELKGM